MPTTLTFEIWDVFTDTPFCGNPLAVVRGASSGDTERMQRIAREFNLSETIFILPPTIAEALVDVRIFTPDRELPFAGHPTVGVAMSLAAAGAVSPGTDGKAHLVLNEKVGPVPVAIDFAPDNRTPRRAAFTTAVTPKPGPALSVSAAQWAGLLGLADADILADRAEVWDAGVPFPIVPLASREALSRAKIVGPVPSGLSPSGSLDNVYLTAGSAETALGTPDRPGRIDVRLFAPGFGIVEDPATGSAAAALAGWLAAQAPANGQYACTILQGQDMGRPSEIRLTLEADGGQAVRVEVAGAAVPVMRGSMTV